MILMEGEESSNTVYMRLIFAQRKENGEYNQLVR